MISKNVYPIITKSKNSVDIDEDIDFIIAESILKKHKMKNLKNLFNLNEKVALVTGGAGYLGSAICESLAELEHV